MIQWIAEHGIYLHRDPVDFRKSINGLCVIIEDAMELTACSGSIFVFCNKRRDKLKVLYWDQTGFALWYKRLEKDKFKWPHKKYEGNVLVLSIEQWGWLLRGLNFMDIQPHQALYFEDMA